MEEVLLATLKVVDGIAVPLASFATGLRATRPTWLFRRPRLLMRSLVAVLIVVPAVEAIAAEFLVPADATIRSGLLIAILAVGIGPPTLLEHTVERTEAADYEVGLNVALLIAAIVYIPSAVAVVAATFDYAIALPPSRVARVVLVQAVVPLVAGIAIARWWPALARPIAVHAPKVVTAATGFVSVVALLLVWRPLSRLGPGPWFVCASIATVAILTGHLLGGPQRDRRRVLAAFSAIRFPPLAILLLSILPQRLALLPIVLAYIVASGVLVTVYAAVMAKR